MTGLVTALIRGDLRRMMADEVQSAARALRRGVTRASKQVQSDLRAQARSAGFRDGGRAIANAWRMQVYPAVGIETLHPAGVVWTKAPAISVRRRRSSTTSGKVSLCRGSVHGRRSWISGCRRTRPSPVVNV